MRLLFIFLISLYASLAFAASDPAPVAEKPSAAKTLIANPVEALKKSLHKEAPPADTEKTEPGPMMAWMDLPKTEREEILRSWSSLPETTRPPFPMYRDTQIEKRSRSGGAETGNAKDAPLLAPANAE